MSYGYSRHELDYCVVHDSYPRSARIDLTLFVWARGQNNDSGWTPSGWIKFKDIANG